MPETAPPATPRRGSANVATRLSSPRQHMTVRVSSSANDITVDASNAFAGQQVLNVPGPSGSMEDAVILGKTGVADYVLRTDSGRSFILDKDSLRPLLSNFLRRLL